jgi:hypothetical protein
VGHFAATEAQSDLHLVAVFQEFVDVAHFDIVVVGVRVWTELDLFDLDDLLLLAGLGLALLGFVLILAEIHDFANGGIGVGRDFNQVQPCLVCHFHGTGGGDHAGIFAVSSDEPDFR